MSSRPPIRTVTSVATGDSVCWRENVNRRSVRAAALSIARIYDLDIVASVLIVFEPVSQQLDMAHDDGQEM